jgi:hypothetical protein
MGLSAAAEMGIKVPATKINAKEIADNHFRVFMRISFLGKFS